MRCPFKFERIKEPPFGVASDGRRERLGEGEGVEIYIASAEVPVWRGEASPSKYDGDMPQLRFLHVEHHSS